MLLHENCMRCGRHLSDPKSRRRGYGPECNIKMLGQVQLMIEFEELDIPGENKENEEVKAGA